MTTAHKHAFDWRTQDGRYWESEVAMRNSSGSEIFLTSDLIVSFVVEDSFLDWPTLRGNIVVTSMFEGLEKTLNTGPIASIAKPYVFRNDGRDEITIYLTPKEEKDSNLDANIWKIDTTFSIYDKEDLAAPNIATKTKKFFFWDKRFQLMAESNLAWSTATATVKNLKRPTGYNPRHSKDDSRKMLTGDALRYVVEQMGYQVNEKLWDRGSTKVNYVSPASFTVNEDLSYLTDLHLSEQDRDICLLTLDTRLQDAKFVLWPINKYFKEAGFKTPGNYQLEEFFLESLGDPVFNEPWKGPFAKTNDPNKSFKQGDNIIRQYEFVDMAGFDNTKAILSKPTYSYDFANKRFICDFRDEDIQNVRTEFSEKYLKNRISGRDVRPLMTLNETKKTNESIQPVFSEYPDKNLRLAHGLGVLLYSGLFLNQFIQFRVMGSTNRLAGRFITIHRMDDSESPLDYKFLGQWFVIRVLHIYHKGRYENQIEAIKIHSYDKVFDE